MQHFLLPVTMLLAVLPQLPAGESPARVVESITWTSSWFGNTLSGGSAANRGMAGGDLGDSVHMQNRHDDMWVQPDGTVVMNTHWDEAHHEVGIYKDGKMVGFGRETGGGRGGWDVTADATHIYAGLAVDWSFKQRGVARFALDGQTTGWPGSKGTGGNRLPLGTTQGLACWQGELFASIPSDKKVVVIRTSDMTVVREFPCERAGKLAFHPVDGTIWMLLARAKDDTASTIIHLTRDGTVLPERITDLVEAQDIAINPKDGLLAVTEDGPDQLVVFYDVTKAPKRVRTFGVKGGVWAGPKPGLVGDDRFHGPRGLGFDASGNLYVAASGNGFEGTCLRAFDPKGKVLWRLEGLMFVDCAAVDPADDTQVFSKDERYVLDHAKPPGQDWRLAAHLHNRFRFPTSGPRGTMAFVSRIAGQRILYTLDMNGGEMGVFRFDGEAAVPCGVFTATGTWQNSPKGRCMWQDANGDQKLDADEWTNFGDTWDGILGSPDSAGNLGHAGWGNRVRVNVCSGLDARGAPAYTKDLLDFGGIDGFTGLDRVKYLPESDTLFVSGSTAAKPRKFGEDKQFITGGCVLARIDRFWKGGNRKPTWVADTVRYDAGHDVKSFDVAGDLLFTVERQTSIVEVFDAASGQHLQQLVPGPELGPVANHVFVDIPYAIRAHQRKDGTYLLIMEDDVYGKNILWRISAKKTR